MTLMNTSQFNDTIHHCQPSSCNNELKWFEQQIVNSIIIFAVICFILCTIPSITNLLDSSRFHYPRRALIHVCTCYMAICTIGYLNSTILGPIQRFSCENDFMLHHSSNSNRVSSICVLNFLAYYYFDSAANNWWIVWMGTWLLATKWQWPHESIKHYTLHIHLFAWAMPYIGTIIALYFHAIDGDPLLMSCSIGNQDPINQFWFIIIPLTLMIIIGLILSIINVVSLVQINYAMKRSVYMKIYGKISNDSINKQLIRLILFTIYYNLSQIIILTCHIMEYRIKLFGECLMIQDHNLTFMKHHVKLLIGIVTGFSICFTDKTITIWSEILVRNHNEQQQQEMNRSNSNERLSLQIQLDGENVSSETSDNYAILMDTKEEEEDEEDEDRCEAS